MAYGTKFIFRYESQAGAEYRILIKKNGYSGSAVQRAIGGTPVLRREKGDRIFGTSLSIPAECVVDGEFLDLYTSDPFGYLAELYAGSTLIWNGYIAPEIYDDPDMAPPYDVTFTATDGLGELKGPTFHRYYDEDAPDAIPVRASIAKVIYDLLDGTGFHRDIYIASSLKYEGAMAANSAWNNVYLDWGTLDGKSYYEVLSAILRTINAWITPVGNAWLIFREADLYHMTGSSLSASKFYVTGGSSGGAISISAPTIGSMDTYNWWPVGYLSHCAEPAKRGLAIFAENVYKDTILKDDGWTGTTPDSDGAITLAEDATAAQTIAAVIAEPMILRFTADHISPRTQPTIATLEVQISRTAWSLDGQTSYVEYLTDTGGWGTAAKWFSYQLGGAETEEGDIEIELPFSLARRRNIGKITSLTITFKSTQNTPVVSNIALFNTLRYKGVRCDMSIVNGAREALPEIESIIADGAGDTALAQSQRLFLDNIPTNGDGNAWNTWETAYHTGSFLAVVGADYADIWGAHRRRTKGTVNVPSGWAETPLLFFNTGKLCLVETFVWNIADDELQVDMVEVSSASVQSVSSVTQDTTIQETGSTGRSSYPASSGPPTADQITSALGYTPMSEAAVRTLIAALSFFELDSNDYVKLKDAYYMLYANGALASAGPEDESGDDPSGGSDVSWGREGANSVPLTVNGVTKTLLLYSAYTALNQLISALTDRVAALEQGGGGGSSPDLTALTARVAALEENQFFEKDTTSVSGETLIKLKDAYSMLYANGALASGGPNDEPTTTSS